MGSSWLIEQVDENKKLQILGNKTNSVVNLQDGYSQKSWEMIGYLNRSMMVEFPENGNYSVGYPEKGSYSVEFHEKGNYLVACVVEVGDLGALPGKLADDDLEMGNCFGVCVVEIGEMGALLGKLADENSYYDFLTHRENDNCGWDNLEGKWGVEM